MIVAIVTSPLVRMGASLVSAGLTAVKSPLVIKVVANRREAERSLVE